ncbi:MAG: LamG-like jellyroll fold domain-containing protein [Pseudomonadota bacterium]
MFNFVEFLMQLQQLAITLSTQSDDEEGGIQLSQSQLAQLSEFLKQLQGLIDERLAESTPADPGTPETETPENDPTEPEVVDSDPPTPTDEPPQPETPPVGDSSLPAPVFALAGATVIAGDVANAIEAEHTTAMEVENGTLTMSFQANSVSGKSMLFSKDGNGLENGGHLTAFIQDGKLTIRQQTDSQSEFLKVPELDVIAGQTYTLAVSFGDDGLKIYVDGELVAAEPEFKQGLTENQRELVIGANGWHRFNDDQSVRDAFDGTISDVALYGSQLTQQEVAAIAGETNQAFEARALRIEQFETLAPAFSQLHHGSDTARDLASEYGFNHHGHLPNGPEISEGTDGDDVLDGTDEADAIIGGLGNDTMNGNGGNDFLQGYYGNDDLFGGDGNDVLDGGHGEDRIDGGAGDDLIISQADGREGQVAFDPNRDEGIDADSADQQTGKVYLDQPINADDELTGGEGADTFYFQTLINAKERFIEEHTNDDGTIRWHGVAGENNNIHDHWVEYIGHDVITDFNKAEGDRIVIEGHTTEIADITYGDENGDGVIDHSVIELYSDQGNGGGAHNDDLLGTIKVYGDLVTEADIEHTAAPAYGIVRDIDRLEEAITPTHFAEERGDIQPPANLPTADGFRSASGDLPVFALPGSTEFLGNRGDEFTVEHTDALSLAQGTIAFSFTPDAISGRDALFSKDARGFVDGGHLTAWAESDGDVKVRIQNQEKSFYLEAKDAFETGQETDFALSFGETGTFLYINGELADSLEGPSPNWKTNDEYLLIGASGTGNTSGTTDSTQDRFEGEIEDFVIYDRLLTPSEIGDPGQNQQTDDTLAIANAGGNTAPNSTIETLELPDSAGGYQVPEAAESESAYMM